ncbi:MAG: leucyl aminopeptidase [Bacteroidota bacterium]
MNVSSLTASPSSVRTDLIAVYSFQDKKSLADLSALSGRHKVRDFSGKEGEMLLLYGEEKSSPRYLFVGAGASGSFSIEKLRRASAAIAKKCNSLHLQSAAILFPELETMLSATTADIAAAITEGCLLSLYKFDKYFTVEKKKPAFKEIIIVTAKKNMEKDIRSGITKAAALCAGTIHARDLTNAPSNEIYPDTLAKNIRKTGRALNFSVQVYDKKKIRSLGLGGVIGVSKGSTNDPRFILLEYGKQFKKSGTIALVGKGVTFDTGGISIKPAAGMAEMKMDMGGAAAVVGTFHSVAALGLRKHLIGVIPAVENMPSGSAIKPGDVIIHYNGKTSEVDNTDAEGRLILADALSYVSRYSPDVVIDLATLTGACVVALGHHATGMMGNDQPTMDALIIAGNNTYERVWQLPLFEEYEKQIKSDIADVKNVGGRWAGAITAGLFLKKFIGTYKWVHLDIAGTAMLEEHQEYIPRGGSGVGVRLLTDFIANWKK